MTGVLAKTATAVAAGAVMVHAAPALTTIAPLRRRYLPGLSGVGRPDHVALTFDDGPDPAGTPRFLDLLRAERVHATFFVLGVNVRGAPGPGGGDRGGRGTNWRYTAGTTGVCSPAARVLRTPTSPAAATWSARSPAGRRGGTGPRTAC